MPTAKKKTTPPPEPLVDPDDARREAFLALPEIITGDVPEAPPGVPAPMRYMSVEAVNPIPDIPSAEPGSVIIARKRMALALVEQGLCRRVRRRPVRPQVSVSEILKAYTP